MDKKEKKNIAAAPYEIFYNFSFTSWQEEAMENIVKGKPGTRPGLIVKVLDEVLVNLELFSWILWEISEENGRW